MVKLRRSLRGGDDLRSIWRKWPNNRGNAQVLIPTDISWCQGLEGRLTEYRSRIQNKKLTVASDIGVPAAYLIRARYKCHWIFSPLVIIMCLYLV